MSFLAPKPPKPPQPDDPEIEDARRRQRIAAANARGRDSTILTGGLGAPGPSNASGATLLGGGRQ